MEVYHYTTGRCWQGIEKDGRIKCMVGKSQHPHRVPLGRNEKPTVWLSTHPVWDETANKSAINRLTGKVHDLDREQTQKFDGGLFRIVIDTENVWVVGWEDYKRTGGANPALIQALYNEGVKRGCKPETEWYVSFNPIPKTAWKDVQFFYKGEWQSIL